MPGLSGGGGGGGGLSEAGLNPGQGQVFQPPNQSGAADWLQGLNNQLARIGWSGYNAQPGGVTLGAAAAPQVTGAAGNTYYPDPGVPGSFGSYGGGAVTGANAAAAAAADPNGLLANLYNNAGTSLSTGASAMSNAYNAAYDPAYTTATSNIQNNPYFDQRLAGASNAAVVGNQALNYINPSLGNVAANAPSLTTSGYDASGWTTANNQNLQNLLSGQQELGPQLSGQAQNLNPQLSSLYGQTVPGLQSLASGLPGQTGAIANRALDISGGLSPQLSTLAGSATSAAKTMTPQERALMNQTVPGLQSLAGSATSAAKTMTPQERALMNQTVPGMQKDAASINALGNSGGYGLGAMPAAARNILNVGQDPQNQLFNKLTQQQTEQSSAINAMSGLGSSPYGAGLTSQNLQNFDINWENQQLQRQATADAAASNLFSTTAANKATKAGIDAQAAGVLNQANAAGSADLAQILNAKLAGGAQSANILNQANTAGSADLNQILNAKLAGGAQSANILNQEGNLQLGANAQALNATLGGAAGAGNLLSQAASAGTGISNQELANLAGASNIYNTQAQGAGTLANTLGGLETAGLSQKLAGSAGTTNQLMGAENLATGLAGLTESSSAAPANAYSNQQQQILNALLQREQASAQGAGALTALTGQQGQAGAMGAGSLQSQAQFANLPYQTSQQQSQNAMAAATNQANYGNNLLTPAQQAINNLESYLGIGQSSSSIGGNLSAIESAINQQNQPNFGALGSLLNTGLGGGSLGSLLYGSGGLSGALGLGSGGLLGGSSGLLGSFGGSPISATVAGPTAPSGILGALGSIFGPIFG